MLQASLHDPCQSTDRQRSLILEYLAGKSEFDDLSMPEEGSEEQLLAFQKLADEVSEIKAEVKAEVADVKAVVKAEVAQIEAKINQLLVRELHGKSQVLADCVAES